MRRTVCPDCSQPVMVAALAETPRANVVLERHEASYGAGRYAIWDDGLARSVSSSTEVLAYPLHRCGRAA